MLVTQEKAQIEGDVTFDESMDMTFDPSTMAMQIRHMIRMYGNPRLAALREYTSNARDSHMEAGYTGPVEVSLPSALHPFLSIRDYGTGLSREGMRGYGTFGRSTKSGDNKYIGGFGLGSKSGLAVSPTFTVVSVKDGRRNTAVITMNGNGLPSLNFLHPEQDTDERNGVTVQIPSAVEHKDWANIIAGNTFLGWDRGTIVINGQEPRLSVHDTSQFSRVEGGWLAVARDRGYGDSIKALVHGVFYDLPRDKFSYTHLRVLAGAVLEIENGTVDILPSRDGLEWSDLTQRAVSKAATVLHTSVVREYQKRIDKAADFRAAKAVADDMDAAGLSSAGMEWKGIPLTWRGDKAIGVGEAKPSNTAKSGYSAGRTMSTTQGLQNVYRHHSVLVTGLSGDLLYAHTQKDRKYPVEMGESAAYVIAESIKTGKMPSDIKVYVTTDATTTNLPKGFVAAMSKVIGVKEFVEQAAAQRKEWVKNRVKPGAGQPAAPKSVYRDLRVIWQGMDRYATSFRTRLRNEKYIESDLATGAHKVVVLHSEDALAKDVLRVHAEGNPSTATKSLMDFIAIEAGKDNVTFVLLARNQKADNLTITGWVHLTDWFKTEIAKATVRTPMQRAVEISNQKTRWGRRLPDLLSGSLDMIEDVDAREFLRAFANPIKEGALTEVAQHFPQYAPAQPEARDYEIRDDYPLIDLLSPAQSKDVVEYLNAVYAARK